MRTGKDRVRVEQTGKPVAIGGVTEIEAAEESIRRAVAATASLREARAAVGYHTLQRRGRA
jgi:hypothetical protein